MRTSMFGNHFALPQELNFQISKNLSQSMVKRHVIQLQSKLHALGFLVWKRCIKFPSSINVVHRICICFLQSKRIIEEQLIFLWEIKQVGRKGINKVQHWKTKMKWAKLDWKCLFYNFVPSCMYEFHVTDAWKNPFLDKIKLPLKGTQRVQKHM